MMVESVLDCSHSQDFGVGGGALPQWKRELLARRAMRRPAPAVPAPAAPPPPPLPPADDEELRYGPGIVNRLRSRYLSLALRVSPPRPTVLRRATSLEHLLDESPPPTTAPCPPSTARPPARAPRAAPSLRRELVKRARSVDALSRLEPASPTPQPAPCPAPRAARVPRRPAPLLRETERPPPDVVRSTLRKFEGGARRPNTKPPPADGSQRYTLTATRRCAQLPPLAAANPVLLRRVGVIRPMPPSAPTPPPLPTTPPPTAVYKNELVDLELAPGPELIINLSPEVTRVITELPPKPEIPVKPEPLVKLEPYVKTEPEPELTITIELEPEPPVTCDALVPIAIERVLLEEGTPEPIVERPISPVMKPIIERSISPIANANIERPISPIPKAKKRPISPIPKAKIERPISPIPKAKIERPISPIPKAKERPISPIPKAKIERPISPIPKAKIERPISPIPKAKERPISPIPKAKDRPISPIPKAKERPISPIPKAKERPISPIPKAKIERPISPIPKAKIERPISPIVKAVSRAPAPVSVVLPPAAGPALTNGVPAKSGAVPRRRGAPSPAVGAVSVVFNFSARKEVPDYIENDGLVLRAARRGTVKPSDDGAVSSDEDASESDGVSHCSPVRFVNDNVLMNNRSSLLQPQRKHRVRHSKLKLQFDDSLTRTFEYPSETSLCEQDDDNPSPAAPATSVTPPATPDSVQQPDQPAAHLASLAANTHIASAALSRYTPSKMSPDAFQLGVTRAPAPPPPPHPPANNNTVKTNGAATNGCDTTDGECEGDGAIDNDQCETERAWSQARLPNTDLLF